MSEPRLTPKDMEALAVLGREPSALATATTLWTRGVRRVGRHCNRPEAAGLVMFRGGLWMLTVAGRDALRRAGL